VEVLVHLEKLQKNRLLLKIFDCLNFFAHLFALVLLGLQGEGAEVLRNLVVDLNVYLWLVVAIDQK
tara:strand:+ start:410 stop:607 length:198 start_codon:yes stop_codon:yes gene_type:complete